MTTTRVKVGVALLILVGGIGTAPWASARPPTMQNSPGYDARLAESRKAWAAWQASQQPAPKVVVPRGSRKKSASGQ
jgi:hypothetical protein